MVDSVTRPRRPRRGMIVSGFVGGFRLTPYEKRLFRWWGRIFRAAKLKRKNK